ncbi:hypothetical protein TR13x_03805 [Caloranaerobacter sp. TR13]|uniref:lysylphosphatidylglycerol synthase transmembrane domain-containing protein n=1 Tax=Caloranaerobacter sp. TR13 TaxID=1302151 RepID=UPI0006D41A71|nr:lysylphosphatidylglycerol synthase transmembrane domain-containing protein [Caloranaerobacter sp. TR13]KPU27660.1 hypothetical protein TR13x_03805 [Caloranaerobacter sp. TR13]
MKRQILNYLLVAILIVITISLILGENRITEIPLLLLKINKIYLLIGILCMVLYWAIDGLIIYYLTKMINSKSSLLKSIKFTMIGQYYNNITPFSSGGQPAQVYVMANESIPIGISTSILLAKFIIFQIVVTLFSVFMFVIKIGFIYKNLKMILPFFAIGIIIRLFGTIALITLFFNQDTTKKLINVVLHLLHKVKIIKNLEKIVLSFEEHLNEYMIGIDKIKENKRISLEISFLTLIQITVYFSITYFIYLSMGFNKASLLDIISIQSLLDVAVSYMPTPGRIGTSEGGFYLFFKGFFGVAMLPYAIFLWRMITYYLNVIIGGIITLADYLKRKNNRAFSD